jgi:hypothetical protein
MFRLAGPNGCNADHLSEHIAAVHHIPPLLQLLDTLLGHAPDVTIRRGTPDIGIAEVDFAARLITLRSGLSPGQMHVALAHELIHLLRGPAIIGHEAQEEALVHAEVVRLLAPRHQLPAILTGVNPTEIADHLVIDRHTARLALDAARAEDTAAGAA